MRLTKLFALLAAFGLAAPALAGGFLIEVDTDGADDGPFTPSPNFSFGTVQLTVGDPGADPPTVDTFGPMTASTSIVGTAVGLTGGDSLFGGNAVSGTTTPNPDTYIYTYDPDVDADNFGPAAGTLLNNDGDVLTALPGGGAGLYAAYATWPTTANVSNSPTNYVLNDGTSDIAMVSVDQNAEDGNEWFKLFEFTLDPSKTYTVTQTNTQGFTAGVPGFSDDNYTNGFVSMRSSGVLFQQIPEPTSALLALAGVCGLGLARRR